MGRQKQIEEQRKLTPAEEKRRAAFEETKAALQSKGYESKDLTVGLVYANFMALLLWLPFVIPLGVWFFAKNPDPSILLIELPVLLLVLVLFLALIVVHELLHGVAWALFAPSHWKAVSFGFIVQYFTPYCTCSEPLQKYQYVIGALLPTVALGILPCVVSVFTGSFALFALGALMILGGGGDLTILLKLLTFKSGDSEVLYMDHPYQGGLVAFVRKKT